MWQKRGTEKTLEEVYLRNLKIASTSEVNGWCIKSKENKYHIAGFYDAVRILKLFRNKKVTIVGDYDADGCTSTAILYLGLKEYGFTDVHYRIPKRFSEGFGLNMNIINEIDEGLIITCDNGITAIEEVAAAKKKGLTVIITDHHKAAVDEYGHAVYPKADVVIDPPALPSSADFDGYCGAGLAYRLICQLFENAPAIKEKYVALAAIGTIGDVMEIREENYVIVRNGLKAMKNPRLVTPGLYALLSMQCDLPHLTAENVAFHIAPVLNALSRLSDTGSDDQIKLLTFKGPVVEAKKLAENAIAVNEKRKTIEKDLKNKALETIRARKIYGLCPLVLAVPNAHEGVVGIVAGALSEKYKRPVLLFTNAKDESGAEYLKGSARSYGEYDMKASLDKHSDLFIRYGGHKGAAGMSVKKENIASLARALNEDAKGSFSSAETGIVYYDLEIKASDIPDVIEEMQRYEPYGEGNPAPTFLVTGFKPVIKKGEYARAIGEHGIKINGARAAAISFDKRDGLLNLSENTSLSFIGTLSDNYFRNEVTHQIVFTESKKE